MNRPGTIAAMKQTTPPEPETLLWAFAMGMRRADPNVTARQIALRAVKVSGEEDDLRHLAVVDVLEALARALRKMGFEHADSAAD